MPVRQLSEHLPNCPAHSSRRVPADETLLGRADRCAADGIWMLGRRPGESRRTEVNLLGAACRDERRRSSNPKRRREAREAGRRLSASREVHTPP
jgi:hypothetical protein